MRRILLDIDGVFGDFISPITTYANKLADTNFAHDDVTWWGVCDHPSLKHVEDAVYEWIDSDMWALNEIQPYPDAVEGMRLLKKFAADHDMIIRILSAPMNSRTWCYARWRWLERHFDIDRKAVIYAHDKGGYNGLCLVDDKLENIKEWIGEHGRKKVAAFLWDRPWNRDTDFSHPKVLRTSSWEAVIERLEKVLA